MSLKRVRRLMRTYKLLLKQVKERHSFMNQVENNERIIIIRIEFTEAQSAIYGGHYQKSHFGWLVVARSNPRIVFKDCCWMVNAEKFRQKLGYGSLENGLCTINTSR